MFCKSKRFIDKPVGCGADAVYDIATKETRIKSFRTDKSDTESLQSDKSSQVFRTPKTIRRNILNSATKKLTTTKSCSSLKCELNQNVIDDIVKTKEVEIRNKDATIREYEQQIKETNNKINQLNIEISELKDNCAQLEDELTTKCSAKSPERKLNELKESLALVKSHHALALEANESIRHEYKVEIDALKLKHEEDLQSTMDLYKTEINELNKRHESDIQNITLDFSNKIRLTQDDYIGQIEMLEENSVEKIKITEIQYEERLLELKAYTDSVFENEQQKWHNNLLKHQDEASIEITRLEFQIQDLKQQLEVSSKNVKDLSNNVSFLQKTIDSKEKQLNEAYSKIDSKEILLEEVKSDLNIVNNQWQKEKETFLKDVSALNRKLDSVTLEKNNMSLALDTTIKTVEVLTMRLRHSYQDVENLKVDLELTQKKLEDNKSEYDQLLIKIIGSKKAVDESQQEILSKNQELTESLANMENDFVEQVQMMKTDFHSDVDKLKSQYMILVNELEEKNMQEKIKYLEIKEKCDEAYNTICDCQNIMFNAECQLETKDQEINELETENDRLTGTLAAVEQERNELQSLLMEFNLLLHHKDQKIHEYIEINSDNNDRIAELEEQVKKISELLEVTEFIIKEKESENNKLKDETAQLNNLREHMQDRVTEINLQLDEYEAQNNELLMKHAYEKDLLQEDIKKLSNQLRDKEDNLDDLKHKISQFEEQVGEFDDHMQSCNIKSLELVNEKLEKDLTEINNKYLDLVGHQNNKQKIKHVIDLKVQNNQLKEENEKLQQTLQKQASQIDKLKKEMESFKLKACSPARKSLLVKGKENSPLGKSPKFSASSSPLTERPHLPLREINL